GYKVERQSPDCGRCPRCRMILWPKPIPRHVRFHDLRHTTATLLLKEGVPLATVQKILRHKDPRLTAGVYGHLDVADMRAGINRLAFGEPGDGKVISLEAGTADGVKLKNHGAPVVRKVEPEERRRPRLSRITRETAALKESGRLDLNQRPLGPEPSALPG